MSGPDYALAAVLGSATIHEAAGRIGALRSDLLPAGPFRAAGPAFTVQCPDGDNLWLHRAIYQAAPGDIIVAATGDEQPIWGYWGEIMSVAARERSIAGLVLEGGSRDHEELTAVGFPVWSLGRCIRGTVKDRERPEGAFASEVVIGGEAVRSGDLVVADLDGVAVVPAADAASVIAAGEQRRVKEARVMEALAGGATTLEIFDLH